MIRTGALATADDATRVRTLCENLAEVLGIAPEDVESLTVEGEPDRRVALCESDAHALLALARIGQVQRRMSALHRGRKS